MVIYVLNLSERSGFSNNFHCKHCRERKPSLTIYAILLMENFLVGGISRSVVDGPVLQNYRRLQNAD